MTSQGIFTVAQLNTIRDAHVAWCASQSVDPKSSSGQEAAAYLLRAYSTECRDVAALIEALERHASQRAEQVRLATPGIASSDDRPVG